jgi:hypothetical protein
MMLATTTTTTTAVNGTLSGLSSSSSSSDSCLEIHPPSLVTAHPLLPFAVTAFNDGTVAVLRT